MKYLSTIIFVILIVGRTSAQLERIEFKGFWLMVIAEDTTLIKARPVIPKTSKSQENHATDTLMIKALCNYSESLKRGMFYIPINLKNGNISVINTYGDTLASGVAKYETKIEFTIVNEDFNVTFSKLKKQKYHRIIRLKNPKRKKAKSKDDQGGINIIDS